MTFTKPRLRVAAQNVQIASHRRSGSLMRLFILLCTLGAGSFTPTCHYKDGSSRRVCDTFTDIACPAIFESQKEPVSSRNFTREIDKHINVTFTLPDTERINSGVIEIPELKCYKFKLRGTNVPNEATVIWLDFLPYWDMEINNDSVKIIRDDCTNYENSEFSLQPYSSTQLLFSYTPIPGAVISELVLLGGECEVNCSGHVNECPINSTILQVTDFTEPKVFSQLHAGWYYCVRVFHEDCVIHTSTVHLKNVTDNPWVKTSSNHYIIPVVAVFIVTVGILTLFVLKKLYYHAGDTLHEPVPPDDSPVDWKVIRERWKKSAHVERLLLLYSRDSPALSEVMKAFRTFLQTFSNFEVLDLFEWEETEEASMNVTGWLTRHITKSDVKLLIVVTGGAMIRQKALLENKKLEFSMPHFLDPVFTQALQLLHDTNLGNDYSRIFLVRFDDFTSSTVELSLIVSLKRYVLLKDLGKLILELKNASDEPNLEDMRNQCPNEVDSLETAIKNTKKFYEENENYFANYYRTVE